MLTSKTAVIDRRYSRLAEVSPTYGTQHLLADLPARGDAPAAHELSASHQERFVVHVDAGADVVGNDRQDFAHMKLVGGLADVKVAVLFVELDERRVGRLDHQAAARRRPGAQGIGRKRLRAGVNDGVTGNRGRNHGGYDARGAILEAAGALVIRIEVVVDVGPGPNFRQTLHAAAKFGGRGRAAGNNLDRQARFFERAERFRDFLGSLVGFVATFVARTPDLAEISHESAEGKAGEGLDFLREPNRLRARSDAAAVESGVKFNQHADRR